MNLESHARRLSSEWEYHSTRGYPSNSIGTIYRLLTAAGDEGRPPSLLELRLIAKELDRLENLIGDQVTRLLNLTDNVIEFAEAVNDALADAETETLADDWKALHTGIDDDRLDELARFYTERGNHIR